MWRQGKCFYRQKLDIHNLIVRNPDGVREPLTQLDCDEARETLGVWQAANGQEKTQAAKLLKKVNEWCTSMQLHYIPSEDVDRAITTTITKTVEYGLIATSLSLIQCQQLVKPIVNRVMPKMKLARNLKRDVVHAPKSCLGVGISNFHVLQTIEKVQALLDHGGKDTHTGILLTTALESHLIEIGLGGQIFHDMRGDDISLLMDGIWMKDIVSCMWKYRIKLITNHVELPTWRENDKFIMEIVLSQRRAIGGFSKQDIQAINRCRRYLNVVTVSDISNGSGTRILRWAKDCCRPQKPTHFSAITVKWPFHGKPSKQDRQIWKDAIQLCFCRSNSGFLRSPLGRWKSECMSKTIWRYNPTRDRVYNLDASGRWRHYRKAYNRATRYRRYILGDWVRQDEVEEAVYIPSVQILSQQYCIISQYGAVLSQTTVDPTYDNYIDELLHKPQFGWVFESITFMHPLPIIADYIRHNMAHFATDGSTEEGKSSSGFLMFLDEEDLLEGGNHVPGRARDQNSFRAEGAGILAVILLLTYICEKYNITTGIVHIYCDSSSSLKKAFGYDLISCTEPSHDIYNRIRTAIKECPLQIVDQWVKGHQDRKKPYSELDFLGKANCRVDRVAGKFMQTHPGNNNIRKRFPSTRWELLLDGEIVNSNLKNNLYHHCTAPAIRKYWSEKNYFEDKPIDGVDWLAFESAARRTQPKQRRWLMKHFAHNSATNVVMHQRGERDNKQCPLCAHPVENSDHLITCDGNEMEEIFTDGLEKLQRWIRTTSEAPIAAVVTEFLLSIREGRDFVLDPLWDENLCILVSKQLNYGQRATAHGFLIHDWREWHRAYLEDMKNVDGIKSPPPDKWVGDLIMHIWDIHFNMWCKRCELAHGSEEKRIITYNGETVDDDLRSLYNNLPHPRLMNSSEKNVFSAPLHKILALPVKKKLRYLRRKRRILDNYLIRNGTNRSRQNMIDFLTPDVTCPPAAPAGDPTDTPSDTPSDIPSELPSDTPSDTPSDPPSDTQTTATQTERTRKARQTTMTSHLQPRRTPPRDTSREPSTTSRQTQSSTMREKNTNKRNMIEKDITEYFTHTKTHDDDDPPNTSCDNRKSSID